MTAERIELAVTCSTKVSLFSQEYVLASLGVSDERRVAPWVGIQEKCLFLLCSLVYREDGGVAYSLELAFVQEQQSQTWQGLLQAFSASEHKRIRDIARNGCSA